MKLALIGMMGSGKSTVAKLIGRDLDLPVFDTDAMVEAADGRRIAEIFAEEGEAGFRKMESAAVEAACASDGGVIATGGGVILSDKLMAMICEAGAVVYLRGTSHGLASKLPAGRARETRPLIRNVARERGTSGVESELRRLLDERGSKYEAAADMTVDVDDLSFEAIAVVVADWWKGEEHG